jgi:hypothetical protein
MNYWLVQLLTEPEADRCRIEGSELTGGRADTNNGHSLLLLRKFRVKKRHPFSSRSRGWPLVGYSTATVVNRIAR